MALKRINKELTDLGRYVISQIIPLAVVSSLSQSIVAHCKVGCLLLRLLLLLSGASAANIKTPSTLSLAVSTMRTNPAEETEEQARLLDQCRNRDADISSTVTLPRHAPLVPLERIWYALPLALFPDKRQHHSQSSEPGTRPISPAASIIWASLY